MRHKSSALNPNCIIFFMQKLYFTCRSYRNKKAFVFVSKLWQLLPISCVMGLSASIPLIIGSLCLLVVLQCNKHRCNDSSDKNKWPVKVVAVPLLMEDG